MDPVIVAVISAVSFVIGILLHREIGKRGFNLFSETVDVLVTSRDALKDGNLDLVEVGNMLEESIELMDALRSFLEIVEQMQNEADNTG